MQVLISDANILIDLEDGLLLDQMFALPFVFKVPDILFVEELEAKHSHLLELGLQLGELSAETMPYAFDLTQQYAQPSRNDCFALALAKQDCCALLTGDKNLRKAAEEQEVEVHGTLWLVESLVEHEVISKEQAHDAYKRMKEYQRRLPWLEAHQRIDEL